MRQIGSIFSSIRGFKVKFGQNPGYDWYFALFVFIVAISIAIAIDGFMFISLSSKSTGGIVAPDLSALSISKEDIDKAIKSIEDDALNASTVPEISLHDPSK